MALFLFVKPCWPYPYSNGDHTYNRIWPPLALLNCAAVLEQQGHEAHILDAHALRLNLKQISSRLQGYDKIFITSSCLDRWQCPPLDVTPFLETVRIAKQGMEEVYVMGYHGTVDPEKILKLTEAKAVLRGEPEGIIRALGAGKPWADIPGLTYFSEGKIMSTQDGSNLDLHSLPLPAYHRIERRRYSYEILGKNFALFEFSRGCPYGCKFCNKTMYGSRLRTKSIQQIILEIRAAVEQYHYRTGYFFDLEFLADRCLAEAVCDFLILKRYPFRWCCQTRADSLDETILNKMQRAGCRLIHMGIESGQQKYLDLSGKNLRLDQAREAVRMCRSAGIQSLVFLLFGFSGETGQDRESALRFAKECDPDYVSFHKIYPYQEGTFYLPDLADNQDIDRFIRKAVLRYYLRPRSLSRMNGSAVLRSFRLILGRLRS
ncbi:MAG: radical SAM protein [Candidatus Omnitrophota bacterium]|jgi:radical SAM superfamily enzyme YgiQ (UPF0313 family)